MQQTCNALMENAMKKRHATCTTRDAGMETRYHRRVRECKPIATNMYGWWCMAVLSWGGDLSGRFR